MWWTYLICAFVALGAGIGAGIGIEKMGQFLYFRRQAGRSGLMNIPKKEQMDIESKELAEKNKVVDTIFLGDSITEQYNIPKFYPDKNYINRGIGGNITLQVLERLESNVLILKPKRIIILIGTNDLFFTIGVKTIVINIGEIINRIKVALPNTEIFIESVYNLNENMDKDINRNNENINKINIGLIELCKNTNTPYLDANEVLADINGQLRKEYTADGLHLNNKGYIVLTNFLKSKIENL